MKITRYDHFENIRTDAMYENAIGDYVEYKEAQAIIDAKNAEIERLNIELAKEERKGNEWFKISEQYNADNQRLRDVLGNLIEIIENTTGVVGWHMNGDVAAWAEFEDVDRAKQALALMAQEG